MARWGGVLVGVMDEKALGKRLQLARKRAGLTQQQLCQKAGLSYSTLAKIERGAIRSPSVFTVAAIAQATGTPLEDLLELEARGLKPPAPSKKRSKSGVTFVYFDVNDVLVRSMHKGFGAISSQAHQPLDVVETVFYRYLDQVLTAKITLAEFNRLMGEHLKVKDFDIEKIYFDNLEIIPKGQELLKWAAESFEVGLLTNHFPGFTDRLQKEGFIPNVSLTAIVDSSKAGVVKPQPKIYEIAQEIANVSATEILFIDNERPNLTEADRQGWQVIWFDDYHPEESIARVKRALEF